MNPNEAEPEDKTRSTLERSTVAFASSLAEAILNKTERDFEITRESEDAPACTTSLWYLPPAELAPDGPATPQKAHNISYRLAAKRRQEFAADLAIRNADSLTPKPRKNHFTVVDLTDSHCHYPVSDDPFFFCGAATKATYCREHARVCHVGTE